MSDDLIKRSDAIAEIYKVRTPDVASHQYAELFINAVRRAPSADRPQGKWIPVSERLPEEDVAVLVTTKENYRLPKWTESKTYEMVSIASWDSEDGWSTKRVLAWMPLPEPWKGADDDND